MTTTPTAQLDPTSVDSAGISIATALSSATNPRLGAAYDNLTWAASVPIWVHQLFSGNWLIASAQRWYGATPQGGHPGVWSAYSTDPTPGWFMIDGLTGARNPVPGQPIGIPTNTGATNRTLVAGASLPPNYLFLLHRATMNGSTVAVLQRFNVGINGAVTLAAEEILPSTNGVVFDKGLALSPQNTNILVFGTDGANKVYKIAKPQGQVGANKTTTRQIIKYTETTTSLPSGWTYFSGTGYTQNPASLGPIQAANGPLTTAGPLSFGAFRNQVLMASLVYGAGQYGAQFWTSRSGQPFTPLGAPVALGAVSPVGGVQLMNNLAPNPASSVLSTLGVASAIPYAYSIPTSESPGTALVTAWDLLAVPT